MVILPNKSTGYKEAEMVLDISGQNSAFLFSSLLLCHCHCRKEHSMVIKNMGSGLSPSGFKFFLDHNLGGGVIRFELKKDYS